MNNTYSTIFTSLQCSAQISRLLLLRYDIQKKTYKQSPWALTFGIFYHLYYDTFREYFFGLRDTDINGYILQEYNTMTLEVIQEYTQHNITQYGSACEGCSVFDSDENCIVEVRTVSDGRYYHAYYVKKLGRHG